ncbi:McrC family protein [Alteromonas sp. KUL49]|uniref:McrC family protein n=1 Tax=Alteromonas sp. KUL49 TaxID=2480798 RepID=UPI00102F2A1B|nr:McrC family protein [Alteromonas sp. KUL49]TAP37346.1 restriction endonuclease [Alteromonas sp. KUL49]GEA12976.1 mcrBC 5-methylcytosine restriction system component family protein [Alteromonas sp. KUL49]
MLHTTVTEYGCLGACERSQASSRITSIPKAAFEHLQNLCICDDSDTPFLKLRNRDGAAVLQVQNYAGVILTPDGTQIEVLPKIAKGEDENAHSNARKALLNMLTALKGFNHLQTSSADISKAKVPLLEVFISQFLKSVNELVKRGLKSGYVKQQDNLFYLKGKLLVGQQLKKNLVNKHKFFVEYDEYLLDRPANRLIHTALLKVAKISKSAQSQKLLRELNFVFDEVQKSKDIKADFSKVKLDRGMGYYKVPLKWAELILNNFSPLTLKGQRNAMSLLFPMELVFESYVAQQLHRALPNHMTLSAQARSKYLVTHGDTRFFNLKPDLEIKENGETTVILDTKWKLIDESLNNGTDKYGLSQVDFYQMFAYGHKYLGGNGNLVLIYPKHDGFTQPIEHSFDFDEKLKLWVIPYDAVSKDTNLNSTNNKMLAELGSPSIVATGNTKTSYFSNKNVN